MKKNKFQLIFLTLVTTFLLSSCTGYNKIMYDHLSNANNYKTYHIEIKNFYYFNDDDNHFDLIDFEQNLDLKNDLIYFAIIELDNFCGGNYLIEDGEFSDYMVLLQIEYNNYKILFENNFFKDYKLNDSLIINSSCWIYMDSNFYYVSSVTYNNHEYLSSEDGLNNIIKMMDKKRSLL